MSIFNKMITLAIITALTSISTQQLEAVAYVTDCGGYAYDESRAATNLAPAIALGTVAIVGIIAIAVQNSHDHHSSSSKSSKHHRHSYRSYNSYNGH